MHKLFISCLLLGALLTAAQPAAAQTAAQTPAPQAQGETLRLPVYPLVLIDPYVSTWSFADKLYEDTPRHRSHNERSLVGALRVDGKVYRFMGTDNLPKQAIVPQSYVKPWQGRYTLDKPAAGWEKPGFDDSGWSLGDAAFGTRDETNVNTLWTSQNIWVRRQIEFDPALLQDHKLFVVYSHDDTFVLYANGVKIADTGYKWAKNVPVALPESVLNTLKDGKLTLAVHCENRTGGGLVDLGLYAEPLGGRALFQHTAEQEQVEVQATQTHYTFRCGDVRLKLSFIAPFFMENLDLMSRPVNYMYYEVSSLDNNPHDVQIYFEASPDWTTSEANQTTVAEAYAQGELIFVKSAKKEQKPLGETNRGSVRANWGTLCLSAAKVKSSYAAGDPGTLRADFVHSGKLNTVAGPQEMGYMAIAKEMGKGKNLSGRIMIGYDDIYSLGYFGQMLRPYWNRDGQQTLEGQFVLANAQFKDLLPKCKAFDADLVQRARKAGGDEYARLCAAVYRQVIAAQKLMETPDGTLLYPSKELSSGGFVSTVDVTYPSAPLFLYYNPNLLKGLMEPVFYYSESGRWTKRYPAHDVGRYPWAKGQDYGEDMPVEEAGNMLVLTAAIAKVEGNADYAQKHWDVLTTWVDYLLEKGLDPANQLCTDDFAGHLARNANLSVKAIMGVASYGYLAQCLGKEAVGKDYMDKARNMAKEWIKLADAKDHYSLAFEKPEGWSQKYNMVWDKLMGWNLFPRKVAQTEKAWYLSHQNPYGLPLDSRRDYTKSDWVMWTATWASDTQEEFQAFIRPLYRFAMETPDRQALTDWHFTSEPKQKGFYGRPVLGGFYIKMLEEKLK